MLYCSIARSLFHSLGLLTGLANPPKALHDQPPLVAAQSAAKMLRRNAQQLNRKTHTEICSFSLNR